MAWLSRCIGPNIRRLTFTLDMGADSAVVEIATLRIIKGWLPRRALALTVEWAVLHRDELFEDWNLCEMRQTPKRIPPLE